MQVRLAPTGLIGRVALVLMAAILVELILSALIFEFADIHGDEYVAACKDMGVEVERPSVQESRREFTVRSGRIIYGLGGVKKPADAAPMVEWAKKHGFKVQMHCGGTSIPRSSTVTADDVMKTKPTVVSHINGGPTAIAPSEVDRLINETDFMLEIVQCGNPKVADYVARQLKAKNQLGRLVFGNDSPSGTGIIPLGILRNICQISSVSGIAAAECIAMATGNTAKAYGLNTAMIEVGKEADFVIMDAPMGSIGADALTAIEAGDVPGVAMVIIDGEIKVKVSRNTPPAVRNPKL